MPGTEADVRSIDAVREWQTALAGYADSLSEGLVGVELELRRCHDWLEEQRAAWRQAVRDCEDEVVRAKAELSQRKYKTWDGREPDCTVQEKAVRMAKARLEHAETQVERVRHWIMRLPKVIEEVYRGPCRRLTGLLEDDLPKGQAELARRVASLEAYAGLRPDFASVSGGSAAVAAPAMPAKSPPPGDAP
jgi:hypothetical protein